jgi:hypothetical protein
MPNRPQSKSLPTQPIPSADVPIVRAAPWTKPVLSVYGDVRQFTMGPTPGVGESGNSAVFKP